MQSIKPDITPIKNGKRTAKSPGKPPVSVLPSAEKSLSESKPIPTGQAANTRPKSLDMVKRPAPKRREAPIEKLARQVFPASPALAAAGNTTPDTDYYEDLSSREAGFSGGQLLLWFICLVLLIGIVWWLFGLQRSQSSLRTDLSQSGGIEGGELRLKALEQEVTDLYDRLKNNGLDNTSALIPRQITALQSDVEQLQTSLSNLQSAGGIGPQGVPGATGLQGPPGPAGTPGSSGTASCPYGDCLSLQATTPGTVETGNINISGVVIASGFEGMTLLVTTATITANLTVGGNITVAGNLTYTGTLSGSCTDLNTNGQAWVWVPGSARHGTLPGFCVMKYEAKAYNTDTQTVSATGTGITLADHIPVSTPEGLPWSVISQLNARVVAQTACDSGCHLITEPQWMTIAENILWTPANWCNLNGTDCGHAPGTAGKFLTAGHNDTGWDGVTPQSLPASPNDADECYQTDGTNYLTLTYTGTVCDGTAGQQRRVFTLSNGEKLWDIAGNVWEWTDVYITQNEQPSVASIVDGTGAYREYTAINQWKGLNYLKPSQSTWNANQRLGRIWSHSNSTDVGVRGFRRGGAWSVGTNAGVFALYLSDSPTYTDRTVGFRVAR